MRLCLRRLLHGNSLSGTIPRELGKLNLLRILDLASNRLSGTIPRELEALTQLEFLDLSNNQLTFTTHTKRSEPRKQRWHGGGSHGPDDHDLGLPLLLRAEHRGKACFPARGAERARTIRGTQTCEVHAS